MAILAAIWLRLAALLRLLVYLVDMAGLDIGAGVVEIGLFFSGGWWPGFARPRAGPAAGAAAPPPRPAAKLLEIPDDVTQAALLPVAYTQGDDFKPAERRPSQHIPPTGAAGSRGSRRDCWSARGFRWMPSRGCTCPLPSRSLELLGTHRLVLSAHAG